MLSSKDLNFVGYTYKNFEIINDYQVPGMGISLSHTQQNFHFFLASLFSCVIFNFLSSLKSMSSV